MTSIIRIKYSSNNIFIKQCSLNEYYIVYIYFVVPVTNNEENTQLEEADKEILININCPLKLILNYIRDIIGLDDTSE